MTPLASDLLGLGAVVVLVLANAFFVAAEYALVRVRRTRVAELAAQNQPNASWVERHLRTLDRSIATTQLGITMAGLALGWVAEPALSGLFEPIVALLPDAVAGDVSRGLSAALAFAVITALTVVLGELTPKGIALSNPEGTALAIARPLYVIGWLFRPIIAALTWAGNLALRTLRLRSPAGGDGVHSVEELKMLVAASAEGGVVEGAEEVMLRAVFDFGDTLVRQVMVPRTEMVAVPSDAPLADIVRVAGEHPFSRLPVYEGDLDQIIGIVHLKDLLRVLQEAETDSRTARDVMREALYIPETARVSSLLARFRRRRQHIAIVLDEYGGTAGVVTLADLAEEIVGEVSDAFDEPEIQPLPDGTALIDGLMPIEEVNEHFGLSLDDPHYDTLAGLVLGRLGRLAHVGDVVVVDGAELRVEALDGLRIARVSLTPAPKPDPSQTGS
ncbi:MAG TPA: hemolysin family protein [Anaerolineales bacterium]|nr:hemolysin family protein [Anaerolineales bacterium]